jgi:hypothetical protein
VPGVGARGIAVEVVRPRQAADARTPEPRPWAELLVGGFPIPKYPEARIGAWAAGRLKRAWTRRRPDWGGSVRLERAAARATTLRLPWSGVVDSYLAEVASVLEFHSVREATASSSAA